MTLRQMIKLCHVYNGEVFIPEKINNTKLGQIWQAEKYVCDFLFNRISESSADEELEDYVESYIGKWNPYGVNEVMSLWRKTKK